MQKSPTAAFLEEGSSLFSTPCPLLGKEPYCSYALQVHCDPGETKKYFVSRDGSRHLFGIETRKQQGFGVSSIRHCREVDM